MWDLLMAAGWTPRRPVSSPRCRVILLNGEKHCDGHLSSNPAFSDWVMGWPPGWTDPLQPVTTLAGSLGPVAFTRSIPPGCSARVAHAEGGVGGMKTGH